MKQAQESLENFKKKLDLEINKGLNIADVARILFSSSIGVLSSYYSFSETALEGAELIPYPEDIAVKKILAQIGGPILNAILNAYFTNLVMQSMAPKIIANNKLWYTAIFTYACIGAAPYIANIIRQNQGHADWFPLIIVAIAYSIQNLKGSEYYADNITCAGKCTKDEASFDYIAMDSVKDKKNGIIKEIQSAISNIKYSYIHTKKILPATGQDLSNFDKITDALSSTSHDHYRTLQKNKLSNCKKSSINLSFWLTTAPSMACAVIGYAMMTTIITDKLVGINPNSNLAPIGFISFLPFTGLLLLVISSVGKALVELIKRRSLPFYMQNPIAKSLAATVNLAIVVLGIYSTATCLYLNDKYFGQQQWYNENRLALTIPALYSTTMFNSYPTIAIFNKYILKNIGRIIDANIRQIADIENIAEKFIKVLSESEEPDEIHAISKKIEDILKQDNTSYPEPIIIDVATHESKDTQPEQYMNGYQKI